MPDVQPSRKPIRLMSPMNHEWVDGLQNELFLTSAHIRRCEPPTRGKELQIKLLQRSTPSLALTDLAARYIERRKDVLDAVAEGDSQTTGASVNSRGRSRQSCMSGRLIQAARGGGRRFLPAQAQNPASRSQSLR
jgi:hypothetical protein